MVEQRDGPARGTHRGRLPGELRIGPDGSERIGAEEEAGPQGVMPRRN